MLQQIRAAEEAQLAEHGAYGACVTQRGLADAALQIVTAGSFVASSDNRKYGSAAGTSNATAPGTWNISDDGKYCVQIEWRRVSENGAAPSSRATTAPTT